MLNFNQLIKSFRFALHGFFVALREEQNMKIHVGVGLCVFVCAIILKLERWEIIVIVLLIGAVIILELLNTAFERLTDIVQPRVHEYVRIVKDMMAGSVLIASIIAVIVGLIVFIPHLSKLFI
jgi:diacylglycerol kinase